ncbi:hypothetical protein FS837_004249 [Tulasnella sp. UAMH 9824]|nr:hypothetical protein FS837_004249 [Tulasnella sp. UAMH 9824]
MALNSQQANLQITFEGNDGGECEDFVAAVHEVAFNEGWLDNEKRLLHFTISRLRRRALRWYATLDPSDRSEWGRFVRALFAQYPEINELTAPDEPASLWSSGTNETNLFAPPIERNADSVPLDPPRPNSRAQEAVETENTATASWFAPSRALSPQNLGGGNLLTGKLRVILEGEDAPPTYIWGGLSQDGTDSKSRVDFKRTTLNVGDALIVNFKPYPEPHSICCVNPELARRDLGIRMNQHSKYHSMIALNGVIPVDAASQDSPDVSRIWNILEDGTLQATLLDVTMSSGHETISTFTTTAVHVDLPGHLISFVKNETRLPEGQPQTGRPMMRGVIEVAVD